MPLRECMQKTTHREYLAWMDWLDDQWEKPSRTDNYLMQIALEIRSVLSKNPRSIKLQHFLLKFLGKEPELTPEQATRQAKARWGGVIRGAKKE